MPEPAKKQDKKTVSVRAVAANVLDQVQSGRSLTAVLSEQNSRVNPSERALLAEICYGSCRWYHRLNSLLGLLLKKPLRKRDSIIHALLICGLYQLMYMRIKPHAVVAETVNTSRILKRPALSGLINGVLRRFQREQEQLVAKVDAQPLAQYSLPAWLHKRLQKAWPDHWQVIVAELLKPPPLILRINRKQTDFVTYSKLLQEQGMSCSEVAGLPTVLIVDKPVAVDMLPGFGDGMVSVQDAGAQLASILLDAANDDEVLDACAAPGGKTCHMLEQADVKMTAIDQDERRLSKVSENLQRLKLQATVEVGDAGEPKGKWTERQYDAILLDVPCSATGVIRRHPDIKLLRHNEDIAELVEQQKRILANAWQFLKPGGRLLYATCSLLPEENDQQVDLFVKKHNNAKVIKIKPAVQHISCEHGVQLLPGLAQTDGFYYALLTKTD